MEFSIQRGVLHRAISHVQSIVERRNVMPMLANVKLVVKPDNTVVLSTTDLDISVSESVVAEVKQPGEVTVPALMLYEIVRKLGGDDLMVTLCAKEDEESKVMITAGASNFDLPSLPANEFPDFEVDGDEKGFKLKASVLQSLFAKTKHAVSNEEARYYLNGVYLHLCDSVDGKKVLRAVATDGHRLARVQTEMPENAIDFEGVIVPKKAVNEIVKLLEDYTDEVEISISGKTIVIFAGNIILSSKLIDGKFPDYEKVIPDANDRELEVAKDDLVRSIDLVISVSNDKTKAVKVNIGDSKVILSATSEINGNARGSQEVNAHYSHNDNVVLGFNSKYMIDSLSAIETKTARFMLSKSYGAVILKSPDNDNDMYILMPIEI